MNESCHTYVPWPMLVWYDSLRALVLLAIWIQKSPLFPATSVIFPQKNPIFLQKSPIFPSKSYTRHGYIYINTWSISCMSFAHDPIRWLYIRDYVYICICEYMNISRHAIYLSRSCLNSSIIYTWLYVYICICEYMNIYHHVIYPISCHSLMTQFADYIYVMIYIYVYAIIWIYKITWSISFVLTAQIT